jgi:hypothetical protein
MDKAQKYWLLFFIFAVLVVAGYRYQQYILQENFLLEVNTTCDPAVDSCFVVDCSPEEDPFCDTTPYKKIEIKTYEAPECLQEHICENFSCTGKETCTETFCSDEVLEDGESCTVKEEPAQPTDDLRVEDSPTGTDSI